MKIQQLKKYIKEQLTSDRKDDRQPSNPEANCDAGMGGFGCHTYCECGNDCTNMANWFAPFNDFATGGGVWLADNPALHNFINPSNSPTVAFEYDNIKTNWKYMGVVTGQGVQSTFIGQSGTIFLNPTTDCCPEFGCADSTALNYNIVLATGQPSTCPTGVSGCDDGTGVPNPNDTSCCTYQPIPNEWKCKNKGNHPKFGTHCVPVPAGMGDFSSKQDCIESGCEGLHPYTPVSGLDQCKICCSDGVQPIQNPQYNPLLMGSSKCICPPPSVEVPCEDIYIEPDAPADLPEGFRTLDDKLMERITKKLAKKLK